MRLILYDRLTALFQMTAVRVAACLILFIQISACSLLTEKVYFGQYEQAEIEREAGFKEYKNKTTMQHSNIIKMRLRTCPLMLVLSVLIFFIR